MEANSKAKVLKRSWNLKQFFQNQALTDFQTGCNCWVKCNINNNNIESTTRAWYGMEKSGNFGMEYGRCLNGKKWKISRNEWKTICQASIPILY